MIASRKLWLVDKADARSSKLANWSAVGKRRWCEMAVRPIALAVPVAIISAFAMRESLQGLGAVSGILAIAVMAVVIFSTSSTLARLATLLRPFVIIAIAVPALWMVLQMAPLPLRGLGNQIWATASVALNEPLADRFTVDMHATMLALSQYNIVIAAVLVTAVVTLDRRQAAQALHILVAITAVISVLSIWRKFSGSTELWGEHIWTGSAAAALGAILSTALAARAIDQLRRHGRSSSSPIAPIAALACAFLSLIVSVAASALWSDFTASMAIMFGVVTVVAVVAIRKWFFGWWGRAGVVATAAVLFVASLAFIPIKRNTDLILALSTQEQTATERMLQDIRPIGTGAGTFAALLPIYRDIGRSALLERPTAAATIAVEMGQTFLCLLLIATVLGTYTLLKCSLSRSYGYLFPAIGVGTSVSLLILAFVGDPLFDLYASLLVAALYGLAFAQSLPGTARENVSWEQNELPQDANDKITTKTARPTHTVNFSPALIRIALTAIGLVLAAQTAWVFSQSWHFGHGLSFAPIARLNDLFSKAVAVQSAREDLRTTRDLPAVVRPGPDQATVAQGTFRPPLSNAFAGVLEYSPLRGDMWLKLAAISKEYAASYDTTALLKMSYYTAPNELDLIPLRISVALGTDAAVKEPELRDLIRRDLKVAITRRPALRPAIVVAYLSASADGRAFAESSIAEFDPNFLRNIRERQP
jgi:hypothetical protein